MLFVMFLPKTKLFITFCGHREMKSQHKVYRCKWQLNIYCCVEDSIALCRVLQQHSHCTAACSARCLCIHNGTERPSETVREMWTWWGQLWILFALPTRWAICHYLHHDKLFLAPSMLLNSSLPASLASCSIMYPLRHCWYLWKTGIFHKHQIFAKLNTRNFLELPITMILSA